jgi:hypothetical protein
VKKGGSKTNSSEWRENLNLQVVTSTERQRRWFIEIR